MTAQIAQLKDAASGAMAEVLVSQGFNCFCWQAPFKEGSRELLWASEGFESGEQRPSSSGIPLLFPFPGRIGKASFEFGGETYQLDSGDAFGNALHGFTFTRPWRIVSQDVDKVVAEFQASVDAPEVLTQWPSDFRIEASYQVSGMQLISDIRYENPGTDDLPCAFGTHAYFRLPLSDQSDMARTVIEAPVSKMLPLQEMLPTGEFLPLPKEITLADGVALADHEFDTVYHGLPSGQDPIVTRVSDPVSGRSISQTCSSDFGCYVIYTPGHREAVCIEPYTTIPDPFAMQERGIPTGLQVLKPGEHFETQIVLEAHE